MKFAGEQAISDMIDQNLVGLLLKTIQSANVLAVDYAVEALAGLAAKGQGYRDFVLFNRCFEIVEERVQKNCLSVDLQSLLFQELMIYPFEKNGSDTASQLLKKHMPMLLNESCNLEPLFHGLCNSLLWEEKWVVDLLEDKNIYALVEEVGRTRSLKDSEIRWMMYLLALVGSKSTKVKIIDNTGMETYGEDLGEDVQDLCFGVATHTTWRLPTSTAPCIVRLATNLQRFVDVQGAL